ncbi:MAG TPA: hypothetical protein VFI56_29395 [Vicinamibacterales bacterium]|nr:hypothetical protein [Vicinamibacterales bacterium]
MRFAAILQVCAILFLAAGCASAPQQPPPVDEAQLTAAGFKIVAAKTPQQQEHLKALPAGQITAWQRTGVHYFIYPDVAHNRIYVGTPKEYAAYQRLRPGNYPSLAAQDAANMASYEKQDAAMQNYTQRDLNDPYYFWDSFDGLGWRP